MNDVKLIKDVTRTLHRFADSNYQQAQQWFFKENIALIGVRTNRVRLIGKQFYRQLPHGDKQAVLRVAEELMKIDLQELRIIGTAWAREQQDSFEPQDIVRFERWIRRYVTNWAISDGVSTWLVGEVMRRYPAMIPKTAPWRFAKNRWLRRTAAVGLIPFIRGGSAKPLTAVESERRLSKIFACADDLLLDEDDMVQKGYGWLLKEASNSYPDEVLDYVLQHKRDMPRVALRYAIEKLSAKDRALALGATQK